MGCGFRPHDHDRTAESMEGGLAGLGGLCERVLGCKSKGGFAVTRIIVGASNDLQMEQNLIGGLPVMYEGHSTNLDPFREGFSPAHEMRFEGYNGCMWECRIAKRATWKMTECMRRTQMKMRCT